MRGEVLAVFPKASLERLLIVPTCQHAEVDLVRTGEAVEGEKDRLLERVSVGLTHRPNGGKQLF